MNPKVQIHMATAKNRKITQEIEHICQEYDPFDPKGSQEIIKKLKALGLPFSEDPFELTNTLLSALHQFQKLPKAPKKSKDRQS